MKKTAIVALIFVFLLGLAGCGQQVINQEDYSYYAVREEMPVLTQDSGPAQGGRLRLFMTTPDSLNPIYTFNPYISDLSLFVFDSLFVADGEKSCVNSLAESWQLSEDGMTLDIRLRDGVKYHDGSEFSAKDVAFTIEAIRNAGSRSPYTDYIRNIDSVMVPDRLNIRIILKKPDPDYLLKLTFPILPGHVFEDWPIDGYDPDKKLIGTGAYKYDSFNEGVISLYRNDDWWYASVPDGLDHPIWIDGIDFIVHDGDYEMMAAFQKNIIDIATVSGNNMDYYSNRSDILYSQYVGNRFEYILISATGADGRRTESSEFRAALLKYLAGYIDLNPLETGIPAVTEVDLGREKAGREDTLEALEQMGMTYDEKKNTLYSYRNGVKTALTLSVKYNSLDLDRQITAEWIQAALQEIGIKVVLENASQEDEIKAVSNGRFDMMILGSRIPLYSNLEETLELLSRALGVEGREAVILPLYRKREAVLYSMEIRGVKNPFWKNIFNGWTEWYIVQSESDK